MARLRKLATWTGLALLVVALLMWLSNSSRLVAPMTSGPQLLAHRGLGQDYAREGLTSETCTAARMLRPEHPYLENTIPSMQAAFDFGADVVELDVHPTLDGRFAVFHDWTVDCRTEGTGVTRELTLGYLQSLDVGYGYTADGGETYPFRAKGIGMLPSLEEVLDAFPDQRLLINVKSNDPREGELLAAFLAELPDTRLERIMAYGGPQPIAVLRDRLPTLRVMSRETLQRCVVHYVAIGWSGYVPASCERSLLLIPLNVAPWLWGWPRRFLRRMAAVGTPVFVVNDYTGGGFSRGLDRVEDLERLPADYAGGIWTDRIDLIALALGRTALRQSD